MAFFVGFIVKSVLCDFAEIKKFYADNPNHYFLTGKSKPTEPRTYRQFFSRFLKRNGLEKVKFHEIRHTFAVRAIAAGMYDAMYVKAPEVEAIVDAIREIQ